MTATLRPVAKGEIDTLWPAASALLAPAIARVALFYAPEDVLARLETSRMQLWVIEDDGVVKTALVTEVMVYPRCLALGIVFVGGEGYGDWKGILRYLVSAGREMGCKAVVANGRDGWARAAGFTKTGTAYAMEIPNV